MKSFIRRIEDLEEAFRSKYNQFLKELYIVRNGIYYDFADSVDREKLGLDSLDDVRKHYTDQGYKIVDIFVFKIPGTFVMPGDRCVPKDNRKGKRVLISVIHPCEIERGSGFDNAEEIARMKEKYDNL